MKNVSLLMGCATLLSTLILSACGGGGGDAGGSGGTTPAASILSGTAAAGAAIIGQVTVKGSAGNTTSALIKADGSYSVDVSGLTAPYRLRAQGTVGGRTIKLFSYAEAADVGGTINITPFTDLIIANAAQQIAEAFFDSAPTLQLDSVEVEAQETALQAKLQNVFDALGVSAAIDLLNSTFSADSSGLDAALDIVRIEVDTGTNIATITNLVENTTIFDDILDTSDNTKTLVVNDPTALTTSASDTKAIIDIFYSISAAFAKGLPTQAVVQDYFSTDFYEEDQPKGLFLTDITTDPTVIGLTFSGISISNLNSNLGTAKVTFYVTINGVVDPEPVNWFAARDATLGWQLRGDQRIVDAYFNFHCNDFDGAGSFLGACGINTRFFDNDFSNNGTANAPIASGTVSIIDGSDGVTVKAVIYLGTPATAAPGDVQVYDEASGNYFGDWKPFGTTLGTIDPSIFVVGDIIQYDVYTKALDVSTSNAPQIAVAAVPAATYMQTLLFVPSTIGLYPSATATTQTAITNFTLGNNLTVAWTLAAGTRNDEILVLVSDSMGNRIETWIETFGRTATTTTFASSLLDSTAATTAGLDANAISYELLVRIYAADSVTGQNHSRDYRATIPGPAATGGGGGGSGTALSCSTNSGWDDTADGGLGAPIVPYSFADFETVVANCATAMTLDYTLIAGKTFSDGAGEITSFDSAASVPTAASPGTGTFSDPEITLPITWYIENAGSYDYLVMEGSISIPNVGVVSFRDTSALTAESGTPGIAGATYTFKVYSEQSNYSTDKLTRATGTDGEIWTSVIIQQ